MLLNLSIAVTVSAANYLTNVPANFTMREFTLSAPWNSEWTPGIDVDEELRTATIQTSPKHTLLTLRLGDPKMGLSWYYYCDGLVFEYNRQPPYTATVTFHGEINNQQPGTGVFCKCDGPLCSTTRSVKARFLSVEQGELDWSSCEQSSELCQPTHWQQRE